MLSMVLLTHALVLSEPASLAALERAGMGFEDQVGSAAIADMNQVFVKDLGDLDKQIADTKKQGYTGNVQTFQAAWLTSADHKFELVGAVPRVDRRLARPGTCGEARLIYRFTLEGQRLPMTAAVIFPLSSPSKGCSDVVEQLAWPDAPTPRLVANTIQAGTSIWRQIASRTLRPVRVEFNVQLARWPYTHTTSFSDQVHYLMRAFTWQDGRLKPMPLENTPDVARLQADDAARSALLTWLEQPAQRAALRQGTLQLPTRFLAAKAVSVSPFGLARLTNRPFSALFQGTGLSIVELRQLDMLSCTGCHQARAVAGFHFLGFERGTQPAWTSLRTPWSAHFGAVQTWRAEDHATVSNGKSAPLPIDPERYGLEHTAGAPCGLGGEPFSTWTCPTGSVCRDDLPLDDRAELGSCHPARPARSGDACDPAQLKSSVNPLLDAWQEGPQAPCADAGVCATSRNGFPGGICARACGKAGGDEQPCVAVPTLGPFTTCLNAGGTFAACAGKHHALAALPACQSTADCRPDFVCVTGSGRAGACVPPYFLHQLTIEHR